MPIILAKGSRSFNAKIAPEIANKGYCSSKKMHYYGVKCHVVGRVVEGSLPTPYRIIISGAKMHDLTAFKLCAEDFHDGIILCDKAYCDSQFKTKCLEEQNLRIITPVKKPKKSELTEEQISFSKLVSKHRQPIESLFNWIIEKTGIQIASKVRSSNGLAVHIFGRLAAAMLIMAIF